MVVPIHSGPDQDDCEIELPREAVLFEDFFDAERARLFGTLALMSGNRAEAEET